MMRAFLEQREAGQRGADIDIGNGSGTLQEAAASSVAPISSKPALARNG
jgi:hypothetical protein